MPVQSATTEATAWASTLGRISGDSPWAWASFDWSSRSSVSRVSRARLAPGVAGLVAQLAAQLQDPVDELALLGPALLEPGQPLLLHRPAAPPTSARREPDVEPRRLLAPDDAQLRLQRLDAPARVLHVGRRGVLAHRHPRAGGVQQAHRLVRELARRDVAMGQLHRRLQRLVEELHPVVLLEGGGHAAQHEQRLVLAGLEHLHHLEAARERRVLLDVLLVLAPGRGRDGAQGAPGQRGLQEVGRVARARRPRRRRSGCGPRR